MTTPQNALDEAIERTQDIINAEDNNRWFKWHKKDVSIIITALSETQRELEKANKELNEINEYLLALAKKHGIALIQP